MKYEVGDYFINNHTKTKYIIKKFFGPRTLLLEGADRELLVGIKTLEELYTKIPDPNDLMKGIL